MKYLILSLGLLFSVASFARTDLAQEGVFVFDSDKTILKSISMNQDLIFDHVSSKGFEVYGPKGLMNYLDSIHIHYIPVQQVLFAKNNFQKILNDYPTAEEVEKELADIHAQYPDLTQLINIGKSAQGRNLLVLKIATHAAEDELKPEFKYISSMHGDEVTGRELMVSLAKDLLASYGKDPEVTSLINATEIFIMPSMNPDGTMLHQRANANGVDLNRSFPDFTESNDNTPDGREPEIQAVMKFQASRNFVMSANYHGGSEVVNYMWDAQPALHPFNDMLVELAHDYADRVDYIKASTEFEGGITNGYAWYQVLGGMQDWSYHWYNDLQFTIELSDIKWPDYSQMDYYYSKNKDAMIQFIRDVHTGAGFQLTSAPNQEGDVQISQNVNGAAKDLGTYHFTHSEFYKVLPAGEYSFAISTSNGLARTIFVNVVKQNSTYKPNYTLVE